MNPPRILRDNRRHARRGPDLTTLALWAAAGVLSAFAAVGRLLPGKPRREALSAAGDTRKRYVEFLRDELERMER